MVIRVRERGDEEERDVGDRMEVGFFGFGALFMLNGERESELRGVVRQSREAHVPGLGSFRFYFSFFSLGPNNKMTFGLGSSQFGPISIPDIFVIFFPNFLAFFHIY